MPCSSPASYLVTASTVFSIAFQQWISPGETRPLTQIADAVLAELRSFAGAGS